MMAGTTFLRSLFPSRLREGLGEGRAAGEFAASPSLALPQPLPQAGGELGSAPRLSILLPHAGGELRLNIPLPLAGGARGGFYLQAWRLCNFMQGEPA